MSNDPITESAERIAGELGTVVYWEWLPAIDKEQYAEGPLLRLSLDEKARIAVDVPVGRTEAGDFLGDKTVRATVEGRLREAIKGLLGPQGKIGFRPS